MKCWFELITKVRAPTVHVCESGLVLDLTIYMIIPAFCLQPDCLDDLAYAIMYELTKLCYRVSEADVIRARNQVPVRVLSVELVSISGGGLLVTTNWSTEYACWSFKLHTSELIMCYSL